MYWNFFSPEYFSLVLDFMYSVSKFSNCDILKKNKKKLFHTDEINKLTHNSYMQLTTNKYLLFHYLIILHLHKKAYTLEK